MAVKQARRIKRLGSHYSLTKYEYDFFPKFMRVMWPFQPWIMRIFAVVLFFVYISIILTMHGYNAGILLWRYRHILTTPTPSQSQNVPTIGGIQINLNKRRNVTIELEPGGYILKPNKFSLVPAGDYTLTIKAPGYLKVSKRITITKSVVYKDYFYLTKDPVVMHSVLTLPGRYYVKQINGKILVCNQSSVIILNPGIERIINKLNYKIETFFYGNQSGILCSSVKNAKLIKIVGDNRVITVEIKKDLSRSNNKPNFSGKLASFVVTDFILQKTGQSFPGSGSNAGQSINERLMSYSKQASNLMTSMKSKQQVLRNIPVNYKVSDLGNKIVLYPSFLMSGHSVPIYEIDTDQAIKVYKKELKNFVGKVQLLDNNLIVMRVIKSLNYRMYLLKVSLYNEANINKPSDTIIYSLPVQNFYDFGYLQDMHHLYFLNGQKTLLIFSDKQPGVQDSSLLAHIHKQINQGDNSFALVRPFIFSYVQTKDLESFNNRLHNIMEDSSARIKQNGVESKSLLEDFRYIYKVQLNTDMLKRFLQQNNRKALNNDCLLWGQDVFCVNTNNITSLLPGIYKLPLLEELSNKAKIDKNNLLADTRIALVNNSLLLYIPKQIVHFVGKDRNEFKIPATYLGMSEVYSVRVAVDTQAVAGADGVKYMQLYKVYKNNLIGSVVKQAGKDKGGSELNKVSDKAHSSEVTLILVGKL